MPPEIRVTLPDGSEKRVPAGSTGADVAKAIGPGLAKAALAVRVNGQVWDLARPLPDGAKVTILTDKDPQALELLRHSSAHVLATAVRQLFPQAKIGFGPPIEDGFYYDFEVQRPFGPEDLEAIEKRMVEDRKSTRLNSSHSQISYAVFCLKKKKYTTAPQQPASRITRYMSRRSTSPSPRPTPPIRSAGSGPRTHGPPSPPSHLDSRGLALA